MKFFIAYQFSLSSSMDVSKQKYETETKHYPQKGFAISA